MKKTLESITQELSTHIKVRFSFDRANLGKLFSYYYPLLSVFIGFLLVAFSMGPYQNGDTTWEHDAMSGVLKYGLPYANGNLMDQPPLGFYIQAVFAKAFGLSINNGTFLVTLFGLGCIALVYGIGKFAYGKTTGFISAALLAFSPWHIVLSRSFLIDVPCLFFSLLSLLVGLIAVRKVSFRLFVVSGIVFAAAFNTKLYAIFILIPLLAFFFYNNPKNLKRNVTWLAAFSIPALLASFLWYQTITGQGMISIFIHTDFITPYPGTIVPTYFFVYNFLVNYGLGWFFIDAIIVSLIVVLVQKSLFRKFFVFDLICLAAVICVVSVNTILGAVLDLKAPFLNAFKYDYQALPFFCLLGASLTSKSVILFHSAKTKLKVKKIFYYTIALAGLILVPASIFYNMHFVNLFSNVNYLIFRVQPGVNVGYSIFNSAPTNGNSLQTIIQFVGFALASSGLFWITRHKLGEFRKLFTRKTKKNLNKIQNSLDHNK
ncbi:MAG TPA: glycosyltransferase family 39 protein [Candidatus Bathyarchaeia archaeon]